MTPSTPSGTGSTDAVATATPGGAPRTGATERSPWPALWALVIGFFMILVDTTIVSVANPAIKEALDPASNNLDNVVWVTSADFGVANLAIAVVGFTVTSMSLPLMFFIQLARGLTPTQSALLLIPMAVLSGVLAPFAGKLLDRTDPRFLLVPGLLAVAGSLVWYSTLMNADTPIWMFLLPSALMGIGNAGMWGPLATTATRNLPMHQAGAGAGIYNTTRTVGSVIGSAAIAAFMQSRLEANLPGSGSGGGDFGTGGTLPPAVVDGFSTAMAQAILLPASVMLIALVAVLFLRRTKSSATADWHAAQAGTDAP